MNFGDSIVDYSKLDLPCMTDVYQNQVFKYVYIPRKANSKRYQIMNEIRKALAGIHAEKDIRSVESHLKRVNNKPIHIKIIKY